MVAVEIGSIADIVKLAWDVYRACDRLRSAGEFRELASQCASIHLAADRIKQVVDSSYLVRRKAQHDEELSELLGNVSGVLKEIQTLVDRNQDLASRRTATLSRIRFSFVDSSPLRSKITVHLAAISLYADGVQLDVQFRIEKRLQSLDQAIRSRAREPLRAISVSSLQFDEDWRELRSELLEDNEFLEEDIDANREAIEEVLTEIQSSRSTALEDAGSNYSMSFRDSYHTTSVAGSNIVDSDVVSERSTIIPDDSVSIARGNQSRREPSRSGSVISRVLTHPSKVWAAFPPLESNEELWLHCSSFCIQDNPSLGTFSILLNEDANAPTIHLLVRYSDGKCILAENTSTLENIWLKYRAYVFVRSKNKIYASGISRRGTSTSEYLLISYDLERDKSTYISKRSDWPSARVLAWLAASNENLYLFGGLEDKSSRTMNDLWCIRTRPDIAAFKLKPDSKSEWPWYDKYAIMSAWNDSIFILPSKEACIWEIIHLPNRRARAQKHLFPSPVPRGCNAWYCSGTAVIGDHLYFLRAWKLSDTSRSVPQLWRLHLPTKQLSTDRMLSVPTPTIPMHFPYCRLGSHEDTLCLIWINRDQVPNRSGKLRLRLNVYQIDTKKLEFENI